LWIGQITIRKNAVHRVVPGNGGLGVERKKKVKAYLIRKAKKKQDLVKGPTITEEKILK
jgi:hypothetical protein